MVRGPLQKELQEEMQESYTACSSEGWQGERLSTLEKPFNATPILPNRQG